MHSFSARRLTNRLSYAITPTPVVVRAKTTGNIVINKVLSSTQM